MWKRVRIFWYKSICSVLLFMNQAVSTLRLKLSVGKSARMWVMLLYCLNFRCFFKMFMSYERNLLPLSRMNTIFINMVNDCFNWLRRLGSWCIVEIVLSSWNAAISQECNVYVYNSCIVREPVLILAALLLTLVKWSNVSNFCFVSSLGMS